MRERTTLVSHPRGTMPAMCEICDGKTYEEVHERQAERIAEHGYVIQPVGDGPDDPNAWAYTMGLLDIADHPEMIVTGMLNTGLVVLSALAEGVLDGDEVFLGDIIHTPFGHARIEPVHKVHYEINTFNSWHSLKESGAIDADELIALEIVMPGHRGPTLANPHSRLGGPQPNRAERRRRNRQRHTR
jgi:hypothetical protein